MFFLLLLCFIVGMAFLMLFSKEGRGCLGGAIGIVLLVIFIIVVGAAVLIGLALGAAALLR